jgi:hypothetical protein
MQATLKETIGPRLSRELYHEGQVVVYVLGGVQRDTLDSFAEYMEAFMPARDMSQPFWVAYDISHTSMTPYARVTVERVIDAIPVGTWGRTAVILPNSAMTVLIAGFINRYFPVQTPNMERRFFTKREPGLEWLVEGVKSLAK